MFEKEAEEYAEEHKEVDWEGFDVNKEDLKKAFKDGAEFGYNKAFVEADKNLKAVVADFNKANEWHDLRKDPNDLPKEDCETVTLHENGNKNIIKWEHGEWFNAIVIPVIAWCKIPVYKENE